MKVFLQKFKNHIKFELIIRLQKTLFSGKFLIKLISSDHTLDAEKNPSGRTGVIGIGSLPKFGENHIEYCLIVSERYIISLEKNYAIKKRYIPKSYELKDKIFSKYKFETLAESVLVDSELNTGNLIFKKGLFSCEIMPVYTIVFVIENFPDRSVLKSN